MTLLRGGKGEVRNDWQFSHPLDRQNWRNQEEELPWGNILVRRFGMI
jgi:hypothetical protein